MGDWIPGVSGLSPGEIGRGAGDTVDTVSDTTGKVMDGYVRALGGGLIDPRDGTPAITDPDYEGPNTHDVTLPATTVPEIFTGAVNDAAGDAPGIALDITNDLLPTWLKMLLFVGVGVLMLWFLRPYVALFGGLFGE